MDNLSSSNSSGNSIPDSMSSPNISNQGSSDKASNDDVSYEASDSLPEIAIKALGEDNRKASAPEVAKSAMKIPGKTSGIVNTLLSVLTDREAIGKHSDAKKRNEEILKVLHNPKTIDPKGVLLKWECEPITINSGSRNRSIEGMFFTSTAEQTPEQQQTKQTVLICTGSHRSCEHYAFPMVESLTSLGHDVMIFNYSGFGDSKGTISEKHIYQDTVAAFDTMQELAARNGLDSSHLKVLGYSLGGAAAAFLGTVRDVDVVLDRTFDRMTGPVEVTLKEDNVHKSLRSLSKRVYSRVTTFDTESRIPSLKGRCLIVNGSLDSLMGPSTEPLHQAARQAMENLQEPDKFAFLEVQSEHEHDPWGLALLNRVKILELDLNHEIEAFRGYTKPHQDLWFGSSQKSARGKEQLDNFLRHGPYSLEDVA